MAQQKAKEEKKDAKPASGEIARGAPAEAAKKEEQPQLSGKQVQQKEAASKKWKGKDWYAILAPKMFNEYQMAETPTTDPATLVGRNIEIGV